MNSRSYRSACASGRHVVLLRYVQRRVFILPVENVYIYKYTCPSLEMPNDYKTYDLGDFKLQSGQTIPRAWIAYKTFGDPSAPAVLYPSWYSGLISDNEWLIGEDKTLNPQKYFIIITALFGNSQSISPSNSDIKVFPDVTFHDNVRAQHELLTKELGVNHLRSVLGWSMGAGQSFQWATQYPVSRFVVGRVFGSLVVAGC